MIDRLYVENNFVDCWPIFNWVEITNTVTLSITGGKNSTTKVYSPLGSTKKLSLSLSFPLSKRKPLCWCHELKKRSHLYHQQLDSLRSSMMYRKTSFFAVRTCYMWLIYFCIDINIRSWQNVLCIICRIDNVNMCKHFFWAIK